jgi:transcriptional regulator with XRE-family HTH domain
MPTSAPEKITNRIRRLRFEKGEMTQQALAEQAGVTRQTIIALESGKYRRFDRRASAFIGRFTVLILQPLGAIA